MIKDWISRNIYQPAKDFYCKYIGEGSSAIEYGSIDHVIADDNILLPDNNNLI